MMSVRVMFVVLNIAVKSLFVVETYKMCCNMENITVMLVLKSLAV